MGRFHPANLRAAWWAVRTVRRTRRVLEAHGLDAALAPPPPPSLPAEAERGVHGALRRWGDTCLVSSIVLQTWEAAHGRRRDLIIGTTSPTDFRAHAWLQGDSLPGPDEPGIDASLLEDGGRVTAAGERGNGGSEQELAFAVLLRRPAPDYGRARSASLE